MAIQPPTPVFERRDDLPPALADVIAKSLNRHSEDRYQSAEEFAAALEPFCDHHEIEKLTIRAEHLAKQNPAAEFNHSAPLAMEMKPVSPGPNPGTGKRFANPRRKSSGSTWVLSVCLLAIAGVLGFNGITIYLDTIAGQLVIESELEGAISVSIVHDEKPTKDIQVEHGSKSTKLRAGKYRIEINGNANDLVVKNGNFELKKDRPSWPGSRINNRAPRLSPPAIKRLLAMPN